MRKTAICIDFDFCYTLIFGVCLNGAEEQKSRQFVKAELLGQRFEGSKRSS